MEMETNADNEYDKFDTDTDDIPQGGDTVDDSYVTSVEDRSAGVPVIKDEEPVEQPNDERNPDSDQALEQDEAEAIDNKNILQGGRTRHSKPRGKYEEPSDDEGLPGLEE